MMSNTILFPKYPRTQDAKIPRSSSSSAIRKTFLSFCHLSFTIRNPIAQNNFIILYKIHLFFKNILYLCTQIGLQELFT